MISLYLRNEGLYYLPDYPEYQPVKSDVAQYFSARMEYKISRFKFERLVERSKANAPKPMQ
jgi:hypothetical protein